MKRTRKKNLLPENGHTLQSILDNTSATVTIFDLKGRILLLNEAAEKVTRQINNGDIGKSVYELLPKESADKVIKDNKEVIRTKKLIEVETLVPLPDGVHTFLSALFPLYDAKGKIYGVCSMGSDITERKKAEENLQKSFKEVADYKFAVDESSIVAITDHKGIIKYVNDNFCKISKYSRAELIGQDHRIINSGYHPKEFIKDLWTTIANGKVWKGELKNKAKDGTVYWVDTTIVPFLNKDGKPYQYLSIRADITGRKKTEEQIKAVNKELEAFTYSVSHDLRAPLRAIDGYAQMMDEDYSKVLDEEGRRLLSVIQYNANKMGTLIDDLLDFSRLGKKEVQKTNLNMNELAKGAWIDLNKSVKHKAEVKIGKLPPAKGDYGLIHQVLVNLISNGIKYSSKTKRPLVEIKSEQKDGELIYSVKDNGAGFDMQYAHKLFGVFQRLHKTEEFEGTGVGLAIVQRIINKHSGKVWAEAEVGKGATFYFSLPENK